MTSWRDRSWHLVDQRVELAIAALRRLPYRAYLRTAHWQRVRTLAIERARGVCALCPTDSGLNVHHRSYLRLGFEAPEDVIVLCDSCHGRHHARIALSAVRATDREPARASLEWAGGLGWVQKA